MRTAFTNDELVHVWASQGQSYGKANSMHFDGPTLFSYSEPIGKFVTSKDRKQFVLTNSRQFSITTSQHQSRMRQAVGHLPTVECAYIPSDRESSYYKTNHERNQEWYGEEINEALEKASRARSEHKVDWLLGRAQSLIQAMRDYSGIFELNWAIPEMPADLNAIRVAVKEREVRKREAEKERVKAQRARQLEQAKIWMSEHLDYAARWDGSLESAEKLATEFHEADERAKYQEKLSQWLNGESVSLPYSNRYGHTVYPTELRIIGEEIETSRGARFPIAHAKRGLALVRAVVARGTEWHRNGETCRLGFYHIDKIEADGTVYAGCHVVPLASIERIAAEIEAFIPSRDSDAA